MNSVTLPEFLNDEAQQRSAAAALRDDDGLICFPCRGTYRIAASLLSEEAVLELLQTKRRSRHKHALVLVSELAMLEQMASEIPDGARRLIEALWPGDLTLRLPLDKGELPRKVYKELSKPDKKVGFRLAVSPAAQLLVRQSGVPLLVSSANLSQKAGAASVAAIRKHFSRDVALFIDSGDLPAAPASTVVDFNGDGYKLVREGTVSQAVIDKAWADGA